MPPSGPPTAPADVDRHLLGLEADPDDPGRLSFLVVPHLCRTDGRFYGGAAIAAALAGAEAATGRRALWISTQLVATADLGERIRIAVDVVAAGRSVDQVHVRGLAGDRLVFNAVGSTATAVPGGLAGTGQVMPRVPPPDDCDAWGGVGPDRGDVPGPEAWRPPEGRPAVGHHLVSEHRHAPLLDAEAGDGRFGPGRMALWARLSGPMAPWADQSSPAALAFLADMVPLACCRAAGVAGAGTSLDNSLRIGERVDTEWVLLDLDAHVAVDGFGHGHVHVWSPDGRMVATGTQSARLFSLADFAARQATKG